MLEVSNLPAPYL